MSLLLAGAAFTSCTKDDLLDAPEADKPVVTVKLNGVAVTSITAEAGKTVPVVVRFDMGAQKDKLEKVKISTTIGSQTFTVMDSTLNEGWFNGADKFHEEKYNVAVGQTISTITFQAVDKKGRIGSTTISVGPNGTVSLEPQRVVLLAGQLNTTSTYGGFYSVMTDKTYKLEDAVFNAQYVDFVYYYGKTHEATISPLSDPIFKSVDAAGKYDGPTNYDNIIRKFAFLNPTKFAVATGDDYTNGKMPSAALTAEGQRNLKVGDCRAFQTVLGQRGIFKVAKLEGTDGSNRSITLDVKVIP